MAVLLSICSLLIAVSPCKSFTKFDHFIDVRKMVGYFLPYISLNMQIYIISGNLPRKIHQSFILLNNQPITTSRIRQQSVRKPSPPCTYFLSPYAHVHCDNEGYTNLSKNIFKSNSKGMQICTPYLIPIINQLKSEMLKSVISASPLPWWGNACRTASSLPA